MADREMVESREKPEIKETSEACELNLLSMSGDKNFSCPTEASKKIAFEVPTLQDLSAQNDQSWEDWKQQQSKLGNDYEPGFPESRKAQDLERLSGLSEQDFQTIGAVADALAQRNIEKTHQLIGNVYNHEHYDMDKMESVDTALRLELERRGLDKLWYASFSFGPEQATFDVQDKSVNLAKNGTEWPSYVSVIGRN